jgi:hypothetical protein
LIPKTALDRLSRPALALVATTLLAGGCANVNQARRLADLPTSASSPAGQAILDADTRPGRYPTFQEIPPVPQDLRPAEGWRQAVSEITADRSRLAAEVAASPVTLTDSEGWAARQAAAAKAPPPPEGPNTEAFAEALRERAKPPPKPN